MNRKVFFIDEKGVAAAMAAIFTATVIGFALLAVDSVVLYKHKKALQAALDMAASAASAHLPDYRTDAAEEEAEKSLKANGYDPKAIQLEYEYEKVEGGLYYAVKITAVERVRCKIAAALGIDYLEASCSSRSAAIAEAEGWSLKT